MKPYIRTGLIASVETEGARKAFRITDAGIAEHDGVKPGRVVKVGAGAEQCATVDPRIVCRCTQSQRCASVCADQPDTARCCLLNEMIDCSTKIVDPTLHRKVTFAATATTKRKRHRCPTQLVGNTINQFGKRARRMSCIVHRNRETMTQQHARYRTVFA